jgi:peptidoglycan/xylan/chitin deacetylase (PgdA/CDA1 family)
MSQINVVMYHYVRPIKGSAFPNIKGLELDGFKRQLDYLSEKFTFITAEDVIDAVINGKNLSNNSCWLTFDDGYKDHFSYVLPELIKRKIQGSFFPPVKPIMERIMLDVNSIHFILASATNLENLIYDLNTECCNLGHTKDEISNLWREYAIPSRYDTKEVNYVKRLLQHALPDSSRNEITSILFRKYVGVCQTDFADNLYMSAGDVRELVNSGMYVGSHGFQHLWLNKEDKVSQKKEIDNSLKFLSTVRARTVNWIMCYPYGAYNQDTIDLLVETKCAAGVTTEVAKADLGFHHPLKLPRFDTNDFPQ